MTTAKRKGAKAIAPKRKSEPTVKNSNSVTLADLRTAQNKTQVELAALTGQTQAALSGFESRSDRRLSSLRRYLKALGGKLEVAAVVRGKRYILDV
jgi:transcriptional regulator with XRE-family HTH domain